MREVELGGDGGLRFTWLGLCVKGWIEATLTLAGGRASNKNTRAGQTAA